VSAAARLSGITLNFDAMDKAPNTRLAHRAVALARDQDFESGALDALYAAHFTEGLDVTDQGVVVTRLAEAGLPDPGALRAALAAGGGELPVEEDEMIAGQIRVSGVPVVIAGRRIGFQGAQDAAVYAQFLAQAPERLADSPPGSAGTPGT
jgi:predicted DsbA family dithiol-disulfide isomerase